MVLAYFFIATLAFAMVSAEPPSPYHYNKPSHSFPAPVISLPPPQPFLPPSTSYGAPSIQSVPLLKPAPIFQSLPSHSISHHVSQLPSPAIHLPAPAPLINIPSTSYGFPSTQLFPSNGLHVSSSNQNTFVSNALGSGSLGGSFDPELKNVIESILLKEESRATAEYEEAPRIVSISMEGPRPAVGVAQFVLNGHSGGGIIGESSHQVSIPSPVYGPSLG